MNINAMSLCSACKYCKYIEVEQETFRTDDNSPYANIFYCKNINICLNAIKIWEKQKEEEKNESNISD